jgi:hypothetical protein
LFVVVHEHKCLIMKTHLVNNPMNETSKKLPLPSADRVNCSTAPFPTLNTTPLGAGARPARKQARLRQKTAQRHDKGHRLGAMHDCEQAARAWVMRHLTDYDPKYNSDMNKLGFEETPQQGNSHNRIRKRLQR